uniref:CSC1/OSCA1-like 7TM region domain-containing protein n=1 Tax=Odontella aurita TaxID=265563 RepID=A0A7S4JEF4_9STRA
MVGGFNAIYLIPVYATSGGEQSALEGITLSNVPDESKALMAATVAAYVSFGAAMFLLYREFAWFTERKHRFMSRPRPDNYTVYVAGIPLDLQSDDALLDYFRQVFSYDAVVDARVAIDIPTLDKLVVERELLSNKLEHAINVLNVTGERPRHNKLSKKRCISGGETVDSIEDWTAKLDKLNDDISKRIDDISRNNSPDGPAFRNDLELALSKSIAYQGAHKQQHLLVADTPPLSLDHGSVNGEISVAAATAGGDSTVLGFEGTAMYNNASVFHGPSHDAILEHPCEGDFIDEESKSNTNDKGGSLKTPLRAVSGIASMTTGIASMTTKTAFKSVEGATGFATSGVMAASKLVLGGEDGTVRDAGFVSFSTLKARASAVQMLHHPAPFTMHVSAAPLPKDIFWGNVGLTHKAQQIGLLVAFALTALLCLFWTLIVAFVTSLGEVEKLTELLPFLKDWLEKAPWLNMFLAQLQPLLLVVLVSLLPPILTAFAKREGHISETALSASLFSKLSIFLLIQLFFVKMISGSIFDSLQDMIENPTDIPKFLAESVPKQATSFMQYVIVQTVLNLGFEIIRVGPIVTAWIRGKFGPNLTEKERETPWMGLTPISVAPEFDFADVQANLILYYMIMFVYSVLAPITIFVMGGAFLLFSMCYRHQLFFVYSTENDSGGLLFVHFARLVVACMIFAEITLMGVLLLQKGAVAGPAMLPLIIITVLFNMYMKQQHYRVTENMPSILCVEEDVSNIGEIDLDFVKGEFLQPALQTRYLQPDNLSSLGSSSKPEESLKYFTPDNSQAEEVANS